MLKVAELVVKALQAKDDNAQLDEVKTGVRELTEKFPLHKNKNLNSISKQKSSMLGFSVYFLGKRIL